MRSTVASEQPSWTSDRLVGVPRQFPDCDLPQLVVLEQVKQTLTGVEGQQEELGRECRVGNLPEEQFVAGPARIALVAMEQRDHLARGGERRTFCKSTRLLSLSWPLSMPRQTLVKARSAASSSSAEPLDALAAWNRRRA